MSTAQQVIPMYFLNFLKLFTHLFDSDVRVDLLIDIFPGVSHNLISDDPVGLLLDQ